MTDRELKAVYGECCDAKGFVGSEGQYKTWKRILGFGEKRDLSRAIDLWYRDNSEFPMPAQLLPLVEMARREHLRIGSGQKHMVMWECATCGYTATGFLPIGASDERTCPSPWGALPELGQRKDRIQLPSGFHCGNRLSVVHDERPVA